MAGAFSAASRAERNISASSSVFILTVLKILQVGMSLLLLNPLPDLFRAYFQTFCNELCFVSILIQL